MLKWDLQIKVPNHLGTWLESYKIKKNAVVTGIEPTTSGLFDQRRNRSDKQDHKMPDNVWNGRMCRWDLTTAFCKKGADLHCKYRTL